MAGFVWWSGFGAAHLLSCGEPQYLECWRKCIRAVNAQAKTEGGKQLWPHAYTEREGWTWSALSDRHFPGCDG